MSQHAEIKFNLDAHCSQCGAEGAAQNGLCLKCIAENIAKGDPGMTEIKAELKRIRNVEVKSKVGGEKDKPLKVVTAVRFEFDGEPSKVQDILLAEAQGQPIDAMLTCPQLTFGIDK